MTDSNLMEVNQGIVRENSGTVYVTLPHNVRVTENPRPGDKAIFFRTKDTNDIVIRFEKQGQDV